MKAIDAGDLRSVFLDNLRIAGAIAGKDLAEAFKNKTILTNIVGMTFIILLLKLMSSFWEVRHFDIVIYDVGSSSLVAELEDSPDYRVHAVSSFQAFEELMDDGDSGDMGLIVPGDYDDLLEAGGLPELGGYVLWQHRNQGGELKAEFEERIAALTSRLVSINIKGTIIDEPSSMGSLRILSLMMVMVLFYVGILTIPHLMLEEKLSKTLDTLLISPATARQVVVGKALAGLVLVLITMMVVLAFNWNSVVDWVLAAVALFSGALLAVGLGLVMGLQFETKQMMNSWTLIIAHPLLLPVFISMVDPIFPESVRTALSWVPTVALSILFRFSFSSGATGTQILTSLAVVLGSAVLVIAIVGWKLRTLDR